MVMSLVVRQDLVQVSILLFASTTDIICWCFFIASAVFANAAFGEGTGPIWMSGLTCGTTQLSLFSCTSTTPIGSVPSSCRHTDDAAVRCQGLATSNHIQIFLPLRTLVLCLASASICIRYILEPILIITRHLKI